MSRGPGMDHSFYEWSPMPGRPPLRWPGGAAIALCVIVSLEQVEWVPEEGSVPAPSAVPFGPYPAVFDPIALSLHDYGNRVGVFRVMRALDRCGLKASAAVDALVAERNSFLVRECLDRGWEPMGHGVSLSRMVTEAMSEATERELIRRSLDALERTTGKRPTGWLGVEYGESSRTLKLLAEEKIEYVCDWPNDEQPYRMETPAGPLVSLPVTAALDDVLAIRLRSIPASRWAQTVVDASDRLIAEGCASGRLLVLNLHPYLIGQPFRIKHLEGVLEYLTGRSEVWPATCGEVVRAYLAA
jgi:allantoinase